MFVRLRHSRLIWLLAVLYLLGAGGTAHGLVLCLGENHLAIEPSHEGTVSCEDHCVPGEEGTAPGAHSFSESIDHEAACVDVVLMGSEGEPAPLRAERTSLQIPRPALTVLAAAGDVSAAAMLRRGSQGEPNLSHPSSPTLLILRSIVLII